MKDFRSHKVRTNPFLLADKAKITIEEAAEAIKVFLEPDEHSLNPANEGRRLQKLESGEYLVLNGDWWSKRMSHEKKKLADRERKQAKKEVVDNGATKTPKPKFVPPTVEEVRFEMAKQGMPESRAEAFVASYASKGWMVGKSPMKDWRQAVITWRVDWEAKGRPGLTSATSKRPMTKEEQEEENRRLVREAQY